jgi:hypothetical protein
MKAAYSMKSKEMKKPMPKKAMAAKKVAKKMPKK